MDEFFLLYIVYVGVCKAAIEIGVEWWDPSLNRREVVAWGLMVQFYWLGMHYFFYLILYLKQYDNLVGSYIINTIGMFVIAAWSFYYVAVNGVFRT